MTWQSNKCTRNFVTKYSHIIPKDFDYKTYIEYHPDLQNAGIDNEQKAKEHYLLFGRKENRTYKLTSQPSPSIKNLLAEKWNNTNNNILYFSPMAPDYDLSSGGNRLLEILKILKQDLQYNVYFLCNGTASQKYLDILSELDISYFLPDLKNMIYLNQQLEKFKASNIEFGSAIFSWYDIADQYVKYVKKYYPNTKIIIDSVDVHWLREQRGKDNHQIAISDKVLQHKKNREKNIYSDADVVFAITESDKQTIQQEIGYHNNIKVLSNIHHQQTISLGNNICFIGNYAHGPNIDGALNSIKIFESFQKTTTYKKLKYKPKLLLAGPNIDNRITSQVNNKNILILGRIDSLQALYAKSSILLSPLTWGAGIKGKICDAGMSGLPILTSDIGNEGIEFSHKNNALIANSQDEFVNKLEYFFNLDKKDRILLGANGQKHLDGIVSVSAAKNILKHTLTDKHIIISIVAYSQTEKLAKCLESILSKTQYNNYSIVISDNSPDLNIKKYIESYLIRYSEKIRYIKHDQNLYFIEANNRIFDDPLYINSDVVLINDDIEILSEYWLNYLYSSAYSANNIAAVGGKTIYPDGKLAEAGAELYKNGRGRNKGRYQDPNDPINNIPHYTGYCSGCLLYLRRDALNKLGGFSKELELLYYEDSEWQYRAHIYGLKTLYDPRCVAIHHEGSSCGTNTSSGAKKYQEINKTKFLNIMRKLGCDNIEIYN